MGPVGRITRWSLAAQDITQFTARERMNLLVTESVATITGREQLHRAIEAALSHGNTSRGVKLEVGSGRACCAVPCALTSCHLRSASHCACCYPRPPPTAARALGQLPRAVALPAARPAWCQMRSAACRHHMHHARSSRPDGR